MVFGDALERIADEPHSTGKQILLAAEIVVDVAGDRVSRQRVDREITPRGIFLPVVGECDRRAPAVGRDIAAKACDLERAAAAHSRYGAVIDPGRHCADLCGFEALDDFFRLQLRRKVHVADRQVQNVVPDGAADETGQPLIGAKGIEEPRNAALPAPL